MIHFILSILFLTHICKSKGKGKGKAIPLQFWADPEVSRRLRPHRF
jgi:hypothetical protein